jgi:hypothetical protein
MLYVIPIGLLPIPITVAVGLFFAWKKLPRPYFIVLLFALTAGPFVVFKGYERSFMMSVVPDALHVTSISYSQEESWGFGPGAHEAGIRVYPLSSQIADEISQRGIEFFNNLPQNHHQQSRKWRGRYEEWSQTPISANDRWKPKDKTSSLNVYDYICAHGFCINIDDAVVKQATEIINSSGSYYAYGRIGLIVVSPSMKLVLYMYNG